MSFHIGKPTSYVGTTNYWNSQFTVITVSTINNDEPSLAINHPILPIILIQWIETATKSSNCRNGFKPTVAIGIARPNRPYCRQQPKRMSNISSNDLYQPWTGLDIISICSSRKELTLSDPQKTAWNRKTHEENILDTSPHGRRSTWNQSKHFCSAPLNLNAAQWATDQCRDLHPQFYFLTTFHKK